MLWVWRLWMRLQTLVRRPQVARQLDDEIQFHLEQQITENVAAGMSREEARHAALRTFGNPTVLKEETRETWGWMWLQQIIRDLRYTARTLRRAPGFALAVILVMALGIGANTALFTIVRSVLLKPLPFGDAKRLVLSPAESLRRGKRKRKALSSWRFGAEADTRSREELANYPSSFKERHVRGICSPHWVCNLRWAEDSRLRMISQVPMQQWF
jgi:hypothetical protein